MSMKDTEVPHSPSHSCDEFDLEEYETRLYSMVYHNSNTYDDESVSGQCSAVADQWSSASHSNAVEYIPNDAHNMQLPNPINRPAVHDKFHLSVRNKASRLDRVKEIISIADSKQSSNNQTKPGKNKSDPSNKLNKKNMSSKKQQTNAENPKTASLYFQNLTKSLNNVQYLQTEQRLIKPVNSNKIKLPNKNNAPKNTSVNSSNALGQDKIFSQYPYRPGEVHKHVPGAPPVFKLDDRLFPNGPRNTAKEEFELSHRLFANKPKEAPDRDRHNHLFNQLPNIPIPSSPAPKKDKPPRKVKRKKQNLKTKRKNGNTCTVTHNTVNTQSSPQDHGTTSLAPVQTNESVVLSSVVSELNSLLGQSNLCTASSDDDPVVILETGPATSSKIKTGSDVPVTISLDWSVDDNVLHLDSDVVELDSDSESVASVIVVTPPSRTPPPVIALEESDDEAPVKSAAAEKILHPAVGMEHFENSFDFLDSCDELDALRKSQVSLFSNMISNSGSKESLLDDRFFQSHEEHNETVNSSAEHGPSASAAVGCNTLTITLTEDPTVGSNISHIEDDTHISIVFNDIDRASSQRVENSTSRLFANSDHYVHDQANGPLSTRSDNFFLDVDLSRCSSSLAIDASNTTEVIVLDAPQVGASSVDTGEKRKRCQQEEEGEPGVVRRKKKRRKRSGKKALEKTRQQPSGPMQKRTGMQPIVYTKIEGAYYLEKDEIHSGTPPQWTREMKHFYNNSWGGENFDVQCVQSEMSRTSKWNVVWEDTRGPQRLQGPFKHFRCFNCSRQGHASFMCPEAVKTLKCHMCGEQGHKFPGCPNKICLDCGRSNRKFTNGCWQCHGVPHPLCSKCIWKHDPSSHCYDVRHAPVPPEAPVDPRPEPVGCRRAPQTLDPDDLRLQLEQKRARSATDPGHAEADGVWSRVDPSRSDEGPQRGREQASAGDLIRPYFEKRRWCDSNRPHDYGSSMAFRKKACRKTRP